MNMNTPVLWLNYCAIIHMHLSLKTPLQKQWILEIQQSTQTISHKKQTQELNIVRAPSNQIHLIISYASFVCWIMNCSIFLCYGNSIFIMVLYCAFWWLLMKKTIRNGINRCKISDIKEKIDLKNNHILVRHIPKNFSSNHLL